MFATVAAAPCMRLRSMATSGSATTVLNFAMVTLMLLKAQYMSLPDGVCKITASKPNWQSCMATLSPVPDWFEVECGVDKVATFTAALRRRYDLVDVEYSDVLDVDSAVHA